ncbi:MAG: hypothetical protein IT168_24000 [Bryobacterales bacterium]|nr:hypothetical protein [Bryobacterales bacterium]
MIISPSTWSAPAYNRPARRDQLIDEGAICRRPPTRVKFQQSLKLGVRSRHKCIIVPSAKEGLTRVLVMTAQLLLYEAGTVVALFGNDQIALGGLNRDMLNLAKSTQLQ